MPEYVTFVKLRTIGAWEWEGAFPAGVRKNALVAAIESSKDPHRHVLDMLSVLKNQHLMEEGKNEVRVADTVVGHVYVSTQRLHT